MVQGRLQGKKNGGSRRQSEVKFLRKHSGLMHKESASFCAKVIPSYHQRTYSHL